MASVHYRNKETGRYATYAQPMSQLEKSDDWERVDKREKPKTATASKDAGSKGS